MRLSSRPLLFPALTLFTIFAGASGVRADTISLSITQEASGTIGNQSFTNQNVTFTGTFSSQQLLSCIAANTCPGPLGPGTGEYTLWTFTDPETTTTLVTTITVGGLGTFLANSGDNFIDINYSGGPLTNVSIADGGDSNGHLIFPVDPFNLNLENCLGDFPPDFCPLSASTSDGALILTSASEDYTTSATVTPDNATVPEPSTLALLATGFLALSGFIRGRFRSA
jgi:PEP-CTERM motif